MALMLSRFSGRRPNLRLTRTAFLASLLPGKTVPQHLRNRRRTERSTRADREVRVIASACKVARNERRWKAMVRQFTPSNTLMAQLRAESTPPRWQSFSAARSRQTPLCAGREWDGFQGPRSGAAGISSLLKCSLPSGRAASWNNRKM